MIKNNFPLALVLLLLAGACNRPSPSSDAQAPAAADSTAAAPAGEWQPLFTGNLSDADFPAGVWTVEDGVLTASEDQAIWTKETYDDFVLDLEFKLAEGTNSGVIVYASDKQNWIPNSVEVQIADDFSQQGGEPDPKSQCGAIYGHKGASADKNLKRPGEWNRYVITCRDTIIEVELNGAKINEVNMSEYTSATTNPDGSAIPEWLSNPMASLATEGYIGLQGKHAGAPVWFRNVRVKRL